MKTIIIVIAAIMAGCLNTAITTDPPPPIKRMTMKPIIFEIDTATRTIVKIEQQ